MANPVHEDNQHSKKMKYLSISSIINPNKTGP
jgi:hypothetical protein